jgi:hypothetical protein
MSGKILLDSFFEKNLMTETTEHFGLQKKDIKNKFISEELITDEDRTTEPVVNQNMDRRPLWQILQEQRKQREDEMDEMYRLANRVRKLDEEEVDFLKQLHFDTKENQRLLKLKEQVELVKFRADVEAKMKEQEIIPVSNPLIAKRSRDKQREILSSGVIVKKKLKKIEGESVQTDKKVSTVQKTSNNVKSLVSVYSSSDEE